MTSSMNKTLCFIALCLLFFKAQPQMLKGERARVGTLKHVVYVNALLRSKQGYGTANKHGAGTLIGYDWVLTAAHTFQDISTTHRGIKINFQLETVAVVAGTKDNSDTTARAQRVTVGKGRVKVHPYYAVDAKYDAALIDVTGNAFKPSRTVLPANLLEPGMRFDADVKCVIQGWGHNELVADARTGQLEYANTSPKHALQGTVDLLEGAVCEKDYNDIDYKKKYLRNLFKSNLQFCYGCKEGRCAPAPGDSGSPVVCALERGVNPMHEGFVFAIHNFGCKDKKKVCNEVKSTVGVDLRKIAEWIEDTRNGRETSVIGYFTGAPTYALGTAVVFSVSYYFLM